MIPGRKRLYRDMADKAERLALVARKENMLVADDLDKVVEELRHTLCKWERPVSVRAAALLDMLPYPQTAMTEIERMEAGQ